MNYAGKRQGALCLPTVAERSRGSHQARNRDGHGQVRVTTSLPALFPPPSLVQMPHSPMYGIRPISRYQKFLQGYLESKDNSIGEPGHLRLPRRKPHGHARRGRGREGHTQSEGKLEEAPENDELRKLVGNSFSIHKQSSTLAAMRQRQLKQRRLRAAGGAEPPWDALGSNGYVAPGQSLRATLREAEQQRLVAIISTASVPTSAHAEMGSPQHRSAVAHVQLNAMESQPNEVLERLLRACRELYELVYGDTLQQNDKDLLQFRQRGGFREVEPLADFVRRPEAEIRDDFDLDEFIEYFRCSSPRSPTSSDAGRGKKLEAAAATTLVRPVIVAGLKELRQKVAGERGEKWIPSLDRCSLAELLKLLWPRASVEDVSAMQSLVSMAVLGLTRAKTPPMLPHDEHQQLVEHFKYLAAKDHDGLISYADLVTAGLVDAETSRELRHRYDLNRDGRIQLSEFLEMLAPHGFRTHEHQCRSLDLEGHPMSFISAAGGGEQFFGWLFDRDMDRIPAKMWQVLSVKFPEDHAHSSEPPSPTSLSSPRPRLMS